MLNNVREDETCVDSGPEMFPSNIDLGDMELFREHFQSSFNMCVQQKEKSIGNKDISGKVSVFLPLLFSKTYEICKFALALAVKNSDFSYSCQSGEELSLNHHIENNYPILRDKIKIVADSWIENTYKILTRWHSDKKRVLESIFNAPFQNQNNIKIVSLDASTGDAHENGAMSLILHLSNNQKIAYKPRCLKVDYLFYQFTKQIDFEEIYRPIYVCKDGYGWMEYIAATPVENTNQLKEYYFNAGLLLSLFHALEAEDIHNENLIAMGTNPVAIDLETLFHHRDDSVSKNGSSSSYSPGNHTVLKTHFIPQFLNNKPDVEAACIYPVFSEQVPNKNSLPVLNGNFVAVNNYQQDFLSGFEQGYARLLKSKDTLLATNSPLNVFKSCRVRYVARTSDIYDKLHKALCHPVSLATVSNQQCILNKLSVDAQQRNFLSRLLNIEARQLYCSQIPRFTHVIDKTDLVDSGGNSHSEFFALSGFKLVEEKIKHLSANDMESQLTLIRNSFVLAKPKHQLSQPLFQSVSSPGAEQLFEFTGKDICKFLLEQNIVLQDSPYWALLRNNGQGQVCLDPTSGTLFDGYSGILLFLAYSSSQFPHLLPIEKLQKQTYNLLNQSLANDLKLSSKAGLSGLGGLLLVLVHLVKIWPSNDELMILCQEVIIRLHKHTVGSCDPDIVNGAAGAILALLSFNRLKADQGAIEVALKFGEILKSQYDVQASSDRPGFGWPDKDNVILTGFSHGIAGIGLALYQLGKEANKPHFIEIARKAFEYESSLFDEEIKNWPDLRFESKELQKAKSMSAWCNGAIGIGLSRMELIRQYGEEVPAFFQHDIKNALECFFNNSMPMSDGLCHGKFGVFELLITAQQLAMLDKSQLFRAQSIIKCEVLNLRKQGMFNPGKFEDYTFMNGWSGIGYQLLRLSSPDKHPSVLLMQ